MKKALFGAFATILVAGCAASGESAAPTAAREEGYVPTGSNIPRKASNARPNGDTLTKDQMETVLRNSPSALPRN
jgi:hypothetical protein